MITGFIGLNLLLVFTGYLVAASFRTEIWDYVRVLPESKLLVTDTSNRTHDNNTIFLIDTNTRCLRTESCEKVKQNAFADISAILRAINDADRSHPIRLIVSVDGGSVVNMYSMLRRLRAHPAGFVAYCNDAMSAGAFITLCADEIVMTRHSRLYKIDTIEGGKETQHYVRYESAIRKLTEQAVNFSILSEHRPYFDFDRIVRLDNALATLKTDLIALSQLMPNWEKLGGTIKKHFILGNTRHFHSFSFEEVLSMGLPARLATVEEESLYFGYFQTN